MKDNFSLQSDQYARYRPTYPTDFFNFIDSVVLNKGLAWDVGTGNGQVAFELAKTFEKVLATDISKSQIDNALKADNIFYSVQPAEKTNFRKNTIDLITIAQAIHWFDFSRFYQEVKRVAKPDALICVTGYGRVEVSESIDPVISNFYLNIVGSYWDKERKYIDENYQTIPFPFEEIPVPHFENKFNWTLEHFTGYLNTWSAVKHFIKQEGFNPVDNLQAELKKLWPEQDSKIVKFPLLIRLGKIS